MILPVEDEFSDVLSKAQKAQGVSTEALAERCGVSESAIRAARKGEFDEAMVAKIGEALGLRVDALIELAKGAWRPAAVGEMEGFAMVCTPFHQWKVNAYLVWDEESKRALAFDAGTDAEPMIDAIRQWGLQLEAIFLTHAHWDHVDGVAGLKKAWPEAAVFLSPDEPAVGVATTAVAEGARYALGKLAVRALSTPGHTKGGISFVVEGLARPLAIVGDALFAGSMGAANESYRAALHSLSRILAQPSDTVLAPGHGPLTTVGEEQVANCFFSAAPKNW